MRKERRKQKIRKTVSKNSNAAQIEADFGNSAMEFDINVFKKEYVRKFEMDRFESMLNFR
jgi:hypothetical protein